MKKNIKNFICLILTLIICSSCSPIQLTIENLITAPKLTGEFEEINKDLKSFAGENITLKYPKSGEFRSPFIMYDIDGDNQKEAIVFYVDNNENDIRFNVLDKVNDSWINVFSTIGPGVDVEKILISNILDTKNDQIIVNWIKPNKIERSLEIYNYENDDFKCIYNKDYLTDVFLFDIDDDSKDELIIIDRTLKVTPNAVVIKKDEESDELCEDSYVRLRSGPLGYEKITLGKLANNVNALFLDARIEDQEIDNFSLYTEVIVSKDHELMNLFFIQHKNKQLFNINSNNLTQQLENILLDQSLRSREIFCRDIDNDSIIEVPKDLTVHYNFKLNNKSEALPLTVWQKYTDKGWDPSIISVENIKDGYSFIFPDNWYELKNINGYLENKEITPLVVSVYNEKNDELIFKTNDKDQKEIMSIKVINTSETPLKGYLEIKRKNNFIYCVKTNYKNNDYKITLNEIKKCFSIIYGG